ncbi:MAG: hypothetical protein KAV00_07160 [Phycisphaerae bacterium]|nr:hypothetical protein [Phycisphaerae bacterium]
MDKPQTRAQLWAFIGAYLNLWLPHKVFTPGHSTPFDFVAEAFFHPERDLAAWANRSGLKTLCASIIAALEYRFADGHLRGRVLAGSEDQARNLYDYWQNWCFSLLADKIVGEPHKQVTRLKNGDFEILSASQKRVRGAKVQRLYRDEVDEIDPEIYGASVGMLASLDDIPARTVDTSTWHYAHGPMARLVEEADQSGIALHKWNVWETIRNCPVERHQKGTGCKICPLGPVCLAKARTIKPTVKIGIAEQACGIFSIDDAIKQYRQWSLQQWEAEAECKRPALSGLVYPQFDRSVHVKPDLDFDDSLPIYRAIDFGLNDFVCLWVQTDKRGNVFVVDEYWANQAKLADNGRSILEADSGEQVEATYVDPAGTSRSDQTGYSDVQVLTGMGIPCQYTMAPWARNVHNGLNLIRGYLQPAAGPPRLFVAGKCKRLIQAFESYALRKVNNEYIDEPIKPQQWDHPMDALRYYFVNRHCPARGGTQQMSIMG